MAFDLARLTRTPDLRSAPQLETRLVCAMRYSHCARKAGDYSHAVLVEHLGSAKAVHGFHVFMDETGRAWPDPIVLNPPCQPALSWDEMLLAQLVTAAATDDRATFDFLIHEMVSASGRHALWASALRLVRGLGAYAR